MVPPIYSIVSDFSVFGVWTPQEDRYSTRSFQEKKSVFLINMLWGQSVYIEHVFLLGTEAVECFLILILYAW